MIALRLAAGADGWTGLAGYAHRSGAISAGIFAAKNLDFCPVGGR